MTGSEDPFFVRSEVMVEELNDLEPSNQPTEAVAMIQIPTCSSLGSSKALLNTTVYA